jgi:hypothetical protein
MIKKERQPIILLAIFCLLSGFWSGLNRIGWDIKTLPITPHHGAIMVGGFLGTLISLEKIIPLKRKGLYLIPALNALSIVFFLWNHPVLAVYMLIASSAALTGVFLYYFRTQQTVIYVLMLLGALCWLTGNVLLLTRFFYPLAFPWWAAFALFIITAERLELMKFLPVSRFDKKVIVSLLFVFLVGVLFSFHGTGNLISGLALIGISLWLMKHDIIAINIRKTGTAKFAAVSLLSGYIALLMTGIFFFALSDQWLTYDALVHSFFVGFVFSMIFAHGPMLLPAVLGISSSPSSKILYLWLATLQVSWIIRVFADVSVEMDVRKGSGLLSVISVVGYFITLAITMVKSQQHGKAV